VLPILLIDEAEAHLHVDAQADLVGELLPQVGATQIFYSTHSPSCLPSDLGTGIRLVDRRDDGSDLKANFWDSDTPGFRPLLFAMGASAGAFSACRWAVITEGPSDMVLLPTLMRRATGESSLRYQVAPGLAHAHGFYADLEEVAAKVVYLTDGDEAGARYRCELLESGVPRERIFGLPEGMGAEDLLDGEWLLAVINEVLPERCKLPEDLAVGDVPIMTRISRWIKDHEPGMRVPGKVSLAYTVIDRDDMKLAPAAELTLSDLHRDIVAALSGSAIPAASPYP
jgi:hypothetical protein